MIDEKKLIEKLEALKAKTIIFRSDIIFNDAINTVIDNINEQPKVNEWIPVEKELPKNNQIVLICKNNCISIHTYDAKGKRWLAEKGNWWWSFNMVDAWMPLPKPYGGKK